ncbi:hypothetical protein [Sporomusa sp. KB1]|jgi:predicted RNA-binding Zn-ribbon protein involved in translation (DUF1610 family)|uniref:hypothetical protein n=1 Tax=Sporomusa sp. KB1 TaxID=943346 RepID=UPI0011AADC82|nr:hypothetical protein [Sporomusa sp. KB1]TWH46941.1 hypothetical protein Salpa_2964 [Sporomusa sp. KB1]
MVISAVSTLALYCPRCGKIELHNVSRFAINNAAYQLVCSCGQVQGAISSAGRRQYLLDIPCVVCETNHLIFLDSNLFRQPKVSKIYCDQANLELGFIGKTEAITATIAKHKQEVASLASEMAGQADGSGIENSQILLEILNKIHDIAEQGGVYCSCGNTDVDVDVLVDAVELSCPQCEGRLLISAKDEQALARLSAMEVLEIAPLRRTSRK